MQESGNAIPEGFITASEAAEFLGYSIQTIYNKVNLGEIPHYKRGRTLRFRRSELDAWLRGDLVTSAA